MNTEAFLKMTYGLYIVTSNFEGDYGGYIANTVFQVTSSPARFAISCSKDNYTNNIIHKGGVFAISILNENYDKKIMSCFGFKSSRETDKFNNITLIHGKTGAPIVKDDCIAWFECKVEQQIDLDSHTLYIGKLIENDMIDKDAHPLTYDYYHKVKRGLAPKNAPTYVEIKKSSGKEEERLNDTMDSYTCDLCGYEYDPVIGDPDQGVLPGTAFEDLPDDWVCPTCDAEKDDFSKS